MEDIMEDLQLHQALLQSLVESHPEAHEEAEELESAIRDLNRRLAQCRGEPLESPRTPASCSSASVPAMPPFDGSGDDDAGSIASCRSGSRPISQSETSEQSPSRGFEVLYPRLHPAGTSQSLPRRKRPYHLTDLGGPSESSSPSKRISSRESRRSTPSAVSVQSFDDGTSVFNDGAEELQRLLGLDNRANLLAMQQEQKEAEKWLQERKEQERRDAEFARSLQASWMEREPQPSRPSSASSLLSLPASTGQFNAAPMEIPLEFQPRLPPLSYNPQPSLPGHGSMYRPQNGFQTFGDLSSAHHPLKPTQQSTILNDSSDSDIAEISARDFQSNKRPLSMMPPSRSWTHVTPDSDMLDEAMDLAGMRRSQSHGFLHPSNAIRNTYNNIVEAGKGFLAGASAKYGLGNGLTAGYGPSLCVVSCSPLKI